MSSPLAVQLCRIVAPEHLSDRFLASNVLTSSETRTLGDQVVLAYLFEVMQPWLPSATLLPALTTTLAAEFKHLSDPKAAGDIDDRFELVLRAVNQTLNQVSESGETDWIGNLSGIIMVLSGNEMHFAQTGRCPAYLLQNNRIRQITDDAPSSPDTHPLKTFANLASGQLKEGDTVLVANHELYREISLDGLRRILSNATPYQATLAVTKELKRQKNPAVASLVLRFLEASPKTSEPEVIILEEELQSNVKKLAKRVGPIATKAKEMGKQAARAAAVAGKGAHETWKNKVKPAATAAIEKATSGKHTPQVASDIPLDDVPIVEIIPSKKKRTAMHLQAMAEAAEARLTQDQDEDFTPAPVLAAPEPTTLPEKAKALGLRALHHAILASQRLRVWLQEPSHRKQAALGAGVFLLILTVFFSVRAGRKPTSADATESNAVILTQVQELSDKLTSAVSQDQQVAAADLASNAYAKLATLKDPNTEQRGTADNLWQTLTAEADKMGKTTRFSGSSAQYTLSGNPRNILARLPYFYGWSGSDGTLVRSGQGEASETEATVTLPEENDSIISVAHSTEADTVGYVLTKQGNVNRLTQIGTTTSLKSIKPATGDFAIGDAIASYAGNVYILDGKAGLLWKYANTGTQYNKGVSIIDINKYDIKKSVSLALDGAIYLLKNDGTVTKFNGGKQDTAFGLRDVPPIAQQLVQPVQLVANENFSSIYLLDAGSTSSPWSSARVLEFNKAGSFIRQYAFPKELTKIHAFDINPKDKKLWALNGNDVVEFNL